MIKRIMAIVILALGLGALVERAKAETFVCADGSSMEVAPEQIEFMKNTQPCVAAYFGIELPLEAALPPLPEKRPTQLAAAAPSANNLKQAVAPEPKSVEPQSDLAALESGTFRRVRVINAKNASSAWYLHTQ